MGPITEPPREIDGAEVIAYAHLAGTRRRGLTRYIVHGVEVHSFAGLAFAQYDDGRGVYVFLCDEDWQTINDDHYDDLAEAKLRAQHEFLGLEIVDVSTD